MVVTGMGVISPNGIYPGEFWDNISGGVSVSHTLEEIKRRGYGNIQGCEVKDFSLDRYLSNDVLSGKFNKKAYAKLKSTDKSIQMSIVATKLALEDSGLEHDVGENNIGIYIGNAEDVIMSQERIVEEVIQRVMMKTFNAFESVVKPFHYFHTKREFSRYKALLQEDKLEEFVDMISKNFGNLHDFTPPSAVDYKSYAFSGKISGFFNFHGPSMTINTACSSGLDAVGQAYRAIKNGGLDAMIAGGAEAPITLQAISTLDALGVISKNKPKPFCLDRDGFAISEGAGILVLEEKGRAKKRGANIYAEVKGYGQSIDGNLHSCAIHSHGKYLKVSMRGALSEAELNPEDVDYINVHGTATKDCERVETIAIKDVFKGHARRLNLSATKAMTGHSIGAIGGVEAIIISLAIRENVVPPTINLDNPDPACDLNNTPISAVSREINNALSISMGFGGYNSALVFGGYNNGA